MLSAAYPCFSRNSQVRRYGQQSGLVGLLFPHPNSRSGLCTVSLGGGVAHARGSDRRPNRRPFYACCRNQNGTVVLFCKVNAKRWCLLAEPSPCGGTIKSDTYVKSVMSGVCWGNSGETFYQCFRSQNIVLRYRCVAAVLVR